MRKLLLVLVGAMLLGISSVVAIEPLTVAVKLPVNLKEIIKEKLNYPEEAQSQLLEGDVWMKICVSENSTIKIVDISSTNPKLGEYVKRELSTLYVGKHGCKVNQIYYLKVKFNLDIK